MDTNAHLKRQNALTLTKCSTSAASFHCHVKVCAFPNIPNVRPPKTRSRLTRVDSKTVFFCRLRRASRHSLISPWLVCPILRGARKTLITVCLAALQRSCLLALPFLLLLLFGCCACDRLVRLQLQCCPT
jgi:hypothetical protein